MKTLPVPSLLELSILGLLRNGACSGYEIRKSLGASPGAVYPALRRLEIGGLTAAGALTPLGRRTLNDALSQALDIQMLRRDPESVAARLRFLDRKQARPFLKDYARLCAEIASQLRGAADLLSQHDAAVFAARARWAQAAIRKSG